MKFMKFYLPVLMVLALILPSFADTVTKPKHFVPGDLITATDMNSNFDVLYTAINGKLDSNNLKAGGVAPENLAALPWSKLTDMPTASAVSNGLLSLSDWAAFHAKLDTNGDGSALVFSATNLKANLNADLLDGLHASAFASTNTTLGQLSDVDMTGIASGKILKYNGSKWAVADQGGGTTAQVKRDFLTYNNAGNNGPIQIKLNIQNNSMIMYRFVVEGYNYGTGNDINSMVCGYTYISGLINTSSTNYSGGLSISQYISSDNYLVIKLTGASYYYTGFSVSGWFVNPTGNGFNVSGVVYYGADL